MKWNEQQKKAIETCFIEDEPSKRCNLLVNAAAGSGKTAVLVERIIRKIENPDGSDIDRLLVVTFTRAAAAEMQQKINRALVARMEDKSLTDEQKTHLMKQLRLLSSADICNIDSYCIRVVRNNFHILGTDPNFSPVSGIELEIMKDEALDLLFEELYESEDEFGAEFVRAAEMFSQSGNDRGLADIIKKLYNFTTSLPEPEKWLDDVSEQINNISSDTYFSETRRDLLERTEDAVTAAVDSVLYIYEECVKNGCIEDKFDIDKTDRNELSKKFQLAAQIVNEFETDGDNEINMRWGNVWSGAVSDFGIVYPLYGAEWEELTKLSGKVRFASLPTDVSRITVKLNGKTVKNNAKASDSNDILYEIRENHENVKEICKGIFAEASSSPDEEIRIVKEFTAKDTSVLCELTKMFIKKLETLKLRRGVLEFCDIERLVYVLLRDNPDIKRAYNERYDEVLIDEYQDVNALQDAIFTLISRGDNMFMVGDMKQSIYRFRNSDPTIFKNKTDSYHDKYNRVINLNCNYRSRENVLESINNVFSLIMSERAGEIDYDDSQRLNAGDKNYEDVNAGTRTDNRSELVLVRAEKESGIGSDEAEAEYVASRIRDMIDSGFKVRRTVQDENGNTKYVYEGARPRDFVILANSTKSMTDIYSEALKRKGLLCYAETEGYFDKSEIMAVMSIIKMIDNPLCDIPFAASMRLPVCGFTDDELACIRLCGGSSMYECTVNMSSAETALGQKCRAFLEQLEKWRFYAKIMTCDKLIMTLYEETDLYAYCGTLENGEQLQANLRMLFQRARDYENTGYKGLFNFIRYIEKIRERSGNATVAKLISEEHDVVRIMTMHKSKGLEFPVVFVVDAAKSFFEEKKKDIYCHKDKGIGLRYINNDMRYSVPTVITKEIEKKNRLEMIAERMRLLYVAMTRAKEKLIITAAEKKTVQQLSFLKGADNSRTVNSARSFFEWLAPIARADSLWKYSEVLIDEIASASETGEKKTYEISCDDKTEVLSWSYKHTESTVSPAKISVTELKRRKLLDDVQDGDSGQMFKKASVRKRPSFMVEQSPLTPSQKGTVVHYIMQTLPPYADKNVIDSHIKTLVETNALTQREADSADREKILAFYSTDIAKRIQSSPKVYREIPFEFASDSAEVYGFSGEEVIIQGIIDCCFEENGDMVLVDYKTDYYAEGQGARLAEKYAVQLDSYARAVEKIMKKRVKEKYLYLFYHNDVIKCD